MTTFIIELLGFLASIISFTIFLPQALRTWKVRRDPIALAGLSVGTQWLIICNATLWGTYAVLTGAFWVGAPGILNAPLAALTIFFVLRARKTPLSISEGCHFCVNEVDHKIFITAPPGWGSLMECSELTRTSGVIVTTEQELAQLNASLAR